MSLFQASVGELIEDLHFALQQSVETYGGVLALACAMQKPHPEISLRVQRKQNSKGEVQRAHFDLLAWVCADPNARATFLAALLERWGYKAPEPITEPTETEQLRALLGVLDGPTGQAVREAAAKVGGFHPRSFRR